MDRVRVSTVRQDNVMQTSYSAFVSEGIAWLPKFHTTIGLRADYFDFDVHSSLVESPKVTMVFGPWADTELFVNYGEGFHSNDARGTTIRVDPTDGVTPVDRVNPLVKARGEEIGVRTALGDQLKLAGSVWTLGLDSELLFVGDGAWSRARFTDDDAAGDRIPNAVDRVASVGIAINRPSGWSGGARLRYLGPAALIEDNSVRSSATTLLNLEAGIRSRRA